MNIDPNKWNFPTVTEKEWDKLLETMTADEACKLIQNENKDVYSSSG